MTASRALVAATLAVVLHAHPAAATVFHESAFSVSRGTRSVGGTRGTASWYSYIPGHAAAGPALRAMLGPKWRGKTVTVRANGRSVRVVLSDWCQCYKGTRAERLIDLDVRAFARLAHPSAGLVKVEVTR